jgi:hypothetical protein
VTSWQPIETAPEPSDNADGRRVRYLISGTWLGKRIVRETEGYRKSTLWENIKPTHWRRCRRRKMSIGTKSMTNPKYMRPGLDFARGKAIEELGELQAALGKSIRWGWTSANPELPMAERVTNVAWVRSEMQDVRDALDNLARELDKEF